MKSTHPLRLVRALYHSVAGFTALWRQEQAFRQEIYAAVIMLPVLYFLPIIALAKLVLIFLWWLLLIVETINSSIEAVIDRISLERHPQSKIAKDMGSAAVALALIMNVGAWLYVLIPLFVRP